MIKNPILPGFHPDPSIVRVGDDYYIATSTFEWYPGVTIHHSRDLINWRLVSRPLNRPDLLNMLGEPDSCGVWAPCLTYEDGRFWLIYTDTKRFDGNFKDTPNYLTTCETIDGEWTSPVYLNSSGFDPSLFHDDDGRKWIVNQVWDHRPDRTFFGGILLQEYSVEDKKLVGEVKNIFPGSEVGFTEGPHIYKKDGWYYLITAEGGTGYGHAVSMARSKTIDGPYELHPDLHVVSARHRPDATLQRAGHGDFVETQNGEIYLVHLCSRPLPNRGGSPMGRETAIQKAHWNDEGWLVLDGEKMMPQTEVTPPDLPPQAVPPQDPVRQDFDQAELPPVFQWLRSPWPEELFNTTDRPGYLRLFGRESLGSWNKQSLVAQRQTSFCYTAQTVVEAEPTHFQQMAGLTCYYNASKYHYVFITHDEKLGKCIWLMSCLGDPSQSSSFPIASPIAIPEGKPVHLRVDVDYARVQFAYAVGDDPWTQIGDCQDTSVLSDEAGKGEGAQFTGAFVGVACQDLAGTKMVADFDYFDYKNRDCVPEVDYSAKPGSLL